MRNLEIESLTRQLSQIERSTPKHPAVSQAMEMVDTVITPYKSTLLKKQVLVSYHGSLQYNDPRNLDLDLVFTTRDRKTMNILYNPVVLKIEDAFSNLQYWPEIGRNRGRCDTNFVTFSMQAVRKDAQDLRKSGRTYDEEHDCAEVRAAYVLTSRILFSEQMELHKKFKAEMYDILTISPVLTQAVIKCLQDTVQMRLARRA